MTASSNQDGAPFSAPLSRTPGTERSAVEGDPGSSAKSCEAPNLLRRSEIMRRFAASRCAGSRVPFRGVYPWAGQGRTRGLHGPGKGLVECWNSKLRRDRLRHRLPRLDGALPALAAPAHGARDGEVVGVA